MTRADGRTLDGLRPVKITTGFIKFAEGSCLIECGDTKVLCCASVEERIPPHVPCGEGWVTAEYSMLPRANRERSRRDVSKLKLSPRSAEIQRLVGRSLRSAVMLENQVLPQLQLLYEGQVTLQQTLAPKERVEVLEDDVITLKTVVKSISNRLAALEKAQ